MAPRRPYGVTVKEPNDMPSNVTVLLPVAGALLGVVAVTSWSTYEKAFVIEERILETETITARSVPIPAGVLHNNEVVDRNCVISHDVLPIRTTGENSCMPKSEPRTVVENPPSAPL